MASNEWVESEFVKALALKTIDNTKASKLFEICLAKKNLKAIILCFLCGIFIREISILGAKNVKPQNEDYKEILERLQKKVEELQEENTKYANEQSLISTERSLWRSTAFQCKQELEQLQQAHDELEHTVKESKMLAPIAFFSPSAFPPHQQKQQRHVSMAHPACDMHNTSITNESDRFTDSNPSYISFVATSNALIKI